MYRVCIKDESLALIEFQSFHSEFENLPNSFEDKVSAERMKIQIKKMMKEKKIQTRPVYVMFSLAYKEKLREEKLQKRNLKLINPNATKVESVIEGQDPLAF